MFRTVTGSNDNAKDRLLGILADNRSVAARLLGEFTHDRMGRATRAVGGLSA